VQYSVLLVLVAAGLALRLADLGRESYWLDEAGRAAIAAQPLAAIPAAVGAIELSPPLYHLLLHGWTRLAGDGDFAGRLLSALLGAAAIPVTYLLAHALFGRRTALVAALLAAVAPLYVVYSREAAMYALFLLLALLAALGHVGWLQAAVASPRRPATSSPAIGARAAGPGGWLGLYAAAMLLALYTHYYALFLLAAQNAHLLLLVWRGGLPAGAGRAWLLAQGALLVAFLPWVPALLRQARLAASVGDWAAPDPLAAVGGLVSAFSVGPTVPLPAGLVALVALPALGVGLRAVARRPGVLALLACYILVPLALGLLAAYPLHAFRERGFIAVAWVPQLLVAAGLVALTRRTKPAAASGDAGGWWPAAGVSVGGLWPVAGASAGGWWPARAFASGWWPAPGAFGRRRWPAAGGHVYAVGFLALLLYGTAAELGEPKEEWRTAAALVATLAREGDVLYLMHYGSQLALDRYLATDLPQRGLPGDFGWAAGYTARYWLEPTDLDARVAPDLPHYRRAWVILSHADGRGDSLLLDYFDARYPALWSQDLYGIRLRLWELRPPEE
jgi:4-amino-4-deoxy-L-arabinose transferase-like glycosyltransferase